MKYCIGVLSLFLLVCMLGCHGTPTFDANKEIIDEMLAEAPVIQTYSCEWETAFVHSYGDWKKAGVDVVRYSIVNYPLSADTSVINDVIRMAMCGAEEHIGIPIRMCAAKDANIIIRFDKLDGVGGKWGVSDFPPFDRKDIHQCKVVLDLYDYYAARSDYSFITGALHEIGHSLGLRHSHDPDAVMYPEVNGLKKKWHFDDVVGLRSLYHIDKDFIYDGQHYETIHRGSSALIRKNFKEKEVWTTCGTYRLPFHWISTNTLDGLQVVRDYFGVPMRITSSYRDYVCNSAKSGTANKSKHIPCQAIDFVFNNKSGTTNANARKSYEKEIIYKGPLFKKMYAVGVRGFGSYNNGSFHIDSRQNHFCTWWHGEPYCTWGRLGNGYGYSVDEDGTTD
jgi:hypothetical protein